MDLQTVKTMLGISTDKHDAYIAAMLPLVIEFAKDHCNNNFLIGVEEVLPGGVQMFAAKAVEYNMSPAGLKGRSMGGASYSYDTDFPPALMKMLRPYRKVRFS